MRTHAFTRSGLFLGVSLIALLTACGGGGGSSDTSGTTPKSTKLTYANNATATTSNWRVEVDSATNGTSKVVLKVFAPVGANIKGLTVFLTCDGTRTQWAQPTGATDPYALAGAALDLTQGPNAAVQLFKSRLSGSDLQIGAYQKTGHLAITADHPVFSVALNLNSSASTGTASPALTTGRTAIYLDDTGEHTLDLKLGTLAAQ